MQWIHDGAAIERLNDAHDFDLGVLFLRVFAHRLFDRNLSARRDVTAFIKTARDTEAVTRRRFCLAPAERFRGSLQHIAQSFVFRILQTKLQRLNVDRVRQLIHVRLAREVVRRGCQRAI